MNETDYAQMKISRENFGDLIVEYMKNKGVSERTIADSIGCSEHTIKRFKNCETYPSDEMLVCGSTLFAIGHEAYEKLSAKDKATIYEKIGAVSGGAIFISDILAALVLIPGGVTMAMLGIIFLSIEAVAFGMAVSVGGAVLLIPAALVSVLGARTGKTIGNALRNRNQEIDGRWEIIIRSTEDGGALPEATLLEGFTVYNIGSFLAVFIEKNNLNVEKVAKSIGCSEISLARILAGKTWATDEMLKQVGAMIAIGFDRYNNLQGAEKERISEAMGSVGGGVLGFGSIAGVIGVLGVPGLSAVGITSGLSALGGIVGAGMLAGVTISAIIPIAAGATGFLVVKAAKKYFKWIKSGFEDFDPKWERPVEVVREKKMLENSSEPTTGNGDEVLK